MQKTLLLPAALLSLNLAHAQLCSGGMAPSVLTLNIAGLNSVDEFNDNNNVRGNLTAAFTGDVVAVNYSNINLNTVGSSWCSEAIVELADVRNTAANYVDLTPSAQGSSGPCTDLPFTGFYDLVDLGFEFPTSATAKVYYELYEEFDDNLNTADATYTSGLLTVYVCPTGQFLPLELESFSGVVERRMNLLAWVTQTEKNVRYHCVERSTDGTHWTEIGRKAGQINSSAPLKYLLEDLSPLAQAYYRLRSVDLDGRESLSNVIQLTRKNAGFGITGLYPSLATGEVTVQFSSAQEETVAIRVLDLTGRQVLQQTLETIEGVNQAPVSLEGLQAGLYTVTVSNGVDVSLPVRFVKQ